MQRHERRDIVIMGAGAAGALLAARLAQAGKSVVVLEGGEPWALGDLKSSQLWARRLKWGGAPVEAGGKDPVGHNFATGSGFGGSAIHHYAGWPRLAEADFTMRSDHGRGLDWPISYNDLRPHYDVVQAEVGVSGDAAQEKWRPPSAPYPLPPLGSFAQGRILSRGFAARGKHVSPAPMAVLSQAYKGRQPCLYDGWCDAGCPIGALANPLVLHVPAARKAGAEFRARAAVTRVAFDKAGRAEALVYRDANGEEHWQPGSAIVLAGAAVQNARLLLAAGTLDPSGLIGRYFAMHSIANVHGLFAEETECHMGLSAGTLTNQDDYAKARRSGPFGSITWGIAPAVKPNDLIGIATTRLDLFGAELDAFMRRAARHLGLINGIVEAVPERDNRVELGSGRDRWGMPLARIVHSASNNTLALWQHAIDDGLAIVRAAGTKEVWPTPRPVWAHVSGGTIMGPTAASSVVDSHGRLHAVPNLFVTGAGQFPTIGAVSPTFTVLALADRAAPVIAAA